MCLFKIPSQIENAHGGLARCAEAASSRKIETRKWREELQKYIWIALGGALGALARVWVGSAVSERMGTRFPYGTFVINITACVLIGFSLEFLDQHVELNPSWRYLIPTGFIGAYSTFSTFEWETFSNLQIGSFLIAGSYVGLSLVLGLVGVWCGVRMAKWLP